MDLREKLADLRGLQVANLTFRGTHLAIALADAGREYPVHWVIHCDECFAFTDDGICAAPLVQGTFGPLGAFGTSLPRPAQSESASFLELQLWNKSDAVVPKFRAVARLIQVRPPRAI